jgi:Tol biopolymer transport system component
VERDRSTLLLPNGPSTWQQRQLTPSRQGVAYTASSFSPDGSTLLATRSVGRGRAEPVVLSLETGVATRLLPDGLQPVYSPDGSRIAFFRKVGRRKLNDLFVLDVESGALHRLTRTSPGYELFASWDPSGERIAFARYRGRHFEWANSIVQINVDGSCEREILARTRRTVYSGPSWQPGRGREAGRIRC